MSDHTCTPALLFAVFLASAGLAVAAPIAPDTTLSNPSVNSTLAPGPDPVFYFTFTIGPDTGHGTVDATDLNVDDEFLATSGTLTVTGGQDVGTYSLYPNPNGSPTLAHSPGDLFSFDDVFYPSTDPPVDDLGLLFTGNGLQIKIYSTGPDAYVFFDDTGYNNTGRTFDVVPEPATFVLLGFGLAGLCFGRRKKA